MITNGENFSFNINSRPDLKVHYKKFCLFFATIPPKRQFPVFCDLLQTLENEIQEARKNNDSEIVLLYSLRFQALIIFGKEKNLI